MSEVHLIQEIADELLAMEKHRAVDQIYEFPATGGSLQIPPQSTDEKEHFILDISKSQINISKGKYQNRARNTVILARLDFGGAPHRNPDDQEIVCPHLHLYREGFGDKWAIPLPQEKYTNTNDRWQLLVDFMKFVNITEPPEIQRGLFV